MEVKQAVASQFNHNNGNSMNDQAVITISPAHKKNGRIESVMDENFSDEDEMNQVSKPNEIFIEHKFNSFYSINNHYDNYENGNSLNGSSLLLKKKRYSMPPGTGPHQCVFCGARFTSAANMNRHRKKHFNIKAFKCCICQKDFGRRDHLTQHLEIHIKTQPFVCVICNENFDAREILKEHLISKHIDNNPEDKICKLCGHESQTSRGAKLHYTSRHFNNRLMLGEYPHISDQTPLLDQTSEVSIILTNPENESLQSDSSEKKEEPDKIAPRKNPRKDRNPTKIVTTPSPTDDDVDTFMSDASPEMILEHDNGFINKEEMLMNGYMDTKCEPCGILFPDRTLYFLHKGFHTEHEPWKCNICGEKCRDKYDFHVHLLSKAHS